MNFYSGTVFHRVIPGFMVQGGGMNGKDALKSQPKAAIKNEASNGLKKYAGNNSNGIAPIIP